jgi:hypothetical protein
MVVQGTPWNFSQQIANRIAQRAHFMSLPAIFAITYTAITAPRHTCTITDNK